MFAVGVSFCQAGFLTAITSVAGPLPFSPMMQSVSEFANKGEYKVLELS
jgi:hypothetical protein